MSQPYLILLAESGPGDLVAFRDAAITYAAARRAKAKLEIQASESARDLLGWLGIAEMEAEGAREPGARTYADPTRREKYSPQTQTCLLAPWGNQPPSSLDTFRQAGYTPETMFAALIRSSYGPDNLDFFPTRSELGFYFDEAQLLEGVARWDREYLEACQTFFMEELMPAELVAKSLAMLPRESRAGLTELAARWERELHAVTFLVCAELRRLAPLSRLVSGLLAPSGPAHSGHKVFEGRAASPSSPAPGLKELVQSVEIWDAAGWSAAWQGLAGSQREALARELCPDFEEQAEAVLFTAGPDLLLWRASAVAEALR